MSVVKRYFEMLPNKALRKVRKTYVFDDFTEYERKRGIVSKVIKNAKINYRRRYNESIREETGYYKLEC